MADYKLVCDGVYDNINHCFIPDDERNPVWRKFQEWAKTNEPDPLATIKERRKVLFKKIESLYDEKINTVYDIPGWTPIGMEEFVTTINKHKDFLVIKILSSSHPDNYDIINGWPTYVV